MKLNDEELKALGIRRTTARGRGLAETGAYIFKCAQCGRDTLKFQLILSRPVYCKACKRVAEEIKRAEKRREQQEGKMLEALMGIDHISEDRFYKASKIARKAANCEQAIKDASVYAGKYGSVPEAVAAILLISCGITIVPQAKIFNNKRSAVDFLLPDYKAVVEIDGKIYHTDNEKQYWRDEEIKRTLGIDWTVLHIPAEDLAKRPKAFKALMKKKFL